MYNVKQLFKHKAIKEWRELVLENSRMNIALDDINKFSENYCVIPEKNNIFNMFRMIYPSQVKVVMVGQSPYPGYCPVTHVPYAFGPAFLPNPECVSTPMTLKKIILEVYRDLYGSYTASLGHPNKILINWINQGVMLLNASFTIGKDCPKYLEDHSLLWAEVVRNILSTISKELNPVFVLIGKEAWNLEECILSSPRILVSHPVARKDTSTPWEGSNVFSRISQMLKDKQVEPIKWL